MFPAVIRIAENAPFMALLLYVSFSRSYQKSTTSFTDDTVAFPIETIAVWLCLLCIPIFLYWAMMASAKLDFSSHYLDTVSKIMEVIIPAWFGLGLLFSLPGTLVVTPEGIEKRFWLRSNREVLWGKITSIIVGEDRVEIAGANGKKIAHERFNLDRERFLFELKRRCSEEDFAERLDQNVAMAARKKRGS
ncbi:hypothetical protein P8936_07730 [Edaphobacter paludis]